MQNFKKSIFIAITLLAIGVSNTRAQVVWGGRVGFSYYTETAKVSGISLSGNATGIELGPVLFYSLSDNFYLNSGAMLGVMLSTQDEIRGKYQNYYIDIPLYLGLKVPLSNSNFSPYLQAGPYVGYWRSSDSATNKIINPLQAGLGIMAGINIKRFKFDIGYKIGLTNLTSNKGGEYLGDYVLLESTSKLSSIFLGISYVF